VFQVRMPATLVASGRWAPMSRMFDGDCGQSHRLRDSRALHGLLPSGSRWQRRTAGAV